jgi:manganese/zinc/iron transport system permease protein
MIEVAEFLQIDLPPMLLGTLAALACGLLGNFLVLRRQSLLGDALSHVVLPGIVVGFLVSGSTGSLPMLLGAGAAALVAVLLIELIRRLGRLESGAAMGVVFTAMFAFGLVLLEQSGARNVHIDVQHALMGNLEGTVWLAASGWGDLVDPAALAAVPESLWRLLAVTLLIAACIALFFKELRLSTFDPGLAEGLGFRPGLIGAGLVGLSALAAVAAFDAVGSILVIAMFICPAATARMLTDDLAVQVWLSAAAAVLAALSGYAVAVFLPLWLGFDAALNTAGAMAVMAGLLQLLAMLFAPRYGVVTVRVGRAMPETSPRV